MRNTSYHPVKTLIDLQPQTTKHRNSKIEELFRSHKKTRSQSSGCSTPKLAGLLNTFQTALNSSSKPTTDRKKIVLQSKPHSRRNSERDNKENIRMGTCQREAKILKLKEQFERTLRKGHCLHKITPITSEDIVLVLNEMSIMKSSNMFFKEFLDTIIEMLKVSCSQLLAANFFLIVLALLNIHLSRKQLQTLVLGPCDQSKVIELDRNQVAKIAQTYQEIVCKSAKQSGARSADRTPPKTNGGDLIQINITLADNKRQEIIFRNSEDCHQIANKIMQKYSIPQQKLKSIEQIIRNKLNSSK